MEKEKIRHVSNRHPGMSEGWREYLQLETWACSLWVMCFYKSRRCLLLNWGFFSGAWGGTDFPPCQAPFLPLSAFSRWWSMWSTTNSTMYQAHFPEDLHSTVFPSSLSSQLFIATTGQSFLFFFFQSYNASMKHPAVVAPACLSASPFLSPKTALKLHISSSGDCSFGRCYKDCGESVGKSSLGFTDAAGSGLGMSVSTQREGNRSAPPACFGLWCLGGKDPRKSGVAVEETRRRQEEIEQWEERTAQRFSLTALVPPLATRMCAGGICSCLAAGKGGSGQPGPELCSPLTPQGLPVGSTAAG